MKIRRFSGQPAARIQDGKNVFVSYCGKWEWYRLGLPGWPKGLEAFASYVTDPKQVAVLDLALLLPEGSEVDTSTPDGVNALKDAARAKWDRTVPFSLIPRERTFQLVDETEVQSTKPGRCEFADLRRTL